MTAKECSNSDGSNVVWLQLKVVFVNPDKKIIMYPSSSLVTGAVQDDMVHILWGEVEPGHIRFSMNPYLWRFSAHPPENCHLNVKKLPNTFFQKQLPKIFIV